MPQHFFTAIIKKKFNRKREVDKIAAPTWPDWTNILVSAMRHKQNSFKTHDTPCDKNGQSRIWAD